MQDLPTSSKRRGNYDLPSIPHVVLVQGLEPELDGVSQIDTRFRSSRVFLSPTLSELGAFPFSPPIGAEIETTTSREIPHPSLERTLVTGKNFRSGSQRDRRRRGAGCGHPEWDSWIWRGSYT
jgi:hypothetical protein